MSASRRVGIVEWEGGKGLQGSEASAAQRLNAKNTACIRKQVAGSQSKEIFAYPSCP